MPQRLSNMSPLKYRDNPSSWEVFLIFLRLGLTSFGGPSAHLVYFREEFVQKRLWVTERTYADLVALCQFLPGPASSQVGMALGFFKRSWSGALLAWLGFTLPSATFLITFALILRSGRFDFSHNALHGLELVAIAVVAHAVWGMSRALCAGRKQLGLMLLTVIVMTFTPSINNPMLVIPVAGLLGLMLFKTKNSLSPQRLYVSINHRTGLILIGFFIGLLFLLPLSVGVLGGQALLDIDLFYRTGALVFGGGHVVLPLLHASVVPPGFVSNDIFMAGYGATQAVPGPLFSFAAFVGASMTAPPTGLLGGIICLIAIFLPSFLILLGTIPFWESLRSNPKCQSAMMGINAAVVGMLFATLISPTSTSAFIQLSDYMIVSASFAALLWLKAPSWAVVILVTSVSWLFSL